MIATKRVACSKNKEWTFQIQVAASHIYSSGRTDVVTALTKLPPAISPTVHTTGAYRMVLSPVPGLQQFNCLRLHYDVELDMCVKIPALEKPPVLSDVVSRLPSRCPSMLHDDFPDRSPGTTL